jgi:spore maturation protein CgeB
MAKRMRILFSSYHNPHFLTITEYIESAIELSGHELIPYDDRQHIVPGRIRSRVGFLNTLDLMRINGKLISLCKESRPDIAVVAGGHRITGPTIGKLKKYDIKSVLWTIDAPINFQPILGAAPFYDHIFCQGTEAIDIFDEKGVSGAQWLPVACDPRIHKRVAMTDGDYQTYGRDIAFVGSYYPNRWEILKALDEYDLGVWGPGWNRVLRVKDSRTHVTDVNLSVSEWLKIYSSAKIVVIVHYQDGEIPCYQASPKVFEALACGCFVLVDGQKDVFDLFEDNEHLVKFEDTKDLKDKINYYLAHPDVRKEIAMRGQDYVLNYHTYLHRINKLISTINP